MFAFNNRRSYFTEAFDFYALFIQGQVFDVCKLQHKHKSLHPQLDISCVLILLQRKVF